MIAGNIFRLIGSLFTDYLFIPFNWLRLTVRNWWSTNTVNWIFLVILLVLFAYWMKEVVRFKNEGTEDRA
ncbi:hypothetical protein ACE1MK_10315 [Tenacibaculum maritimum]|uniref:DUF6341 family protein n=1 Tax=Tenacibaculum maritimum TaxID=107401 RepID=UPI0012E4DB5B|nr:hypothetical protein [Tenacibaculum maritimum]MCD9582262.1 hypothetical protein [Tenacibaculum maritimum]MCD9634584.1 hypothetical protein [Tenacibaculum maritimum]MDB0600771.1 hypothetical protein [Tenacibaculum maritimum]MDB0611022.1 hypothetical protein [Tenacibaculum maritimum]CAA0155329.1 conserved hypothetical protein [Tenacibaculum maritimum]